MPKIKYIRVIPLLILILTSGVISVTAQQDDQKTLTLKLNRDFGFGLGGFMQGTFSLRVTSPLEMRRVDFMLDDTIIESIISEPYETTIRTSDYALGNHQFQAVGYTDSGQTLLSNMIHKQFIPGSTTTLVVIVIVGLVLIGRFASNLISRSKSITKDGSIDFGFLGGTICPKCGKTFGIHWWSLRLGFRRFDRCSNCGKWSFIQRASPEALVEVTQSSNTRQQPEFDAQLDEKDQLSKYKNALDDSRFDNN